MRKQLLFGALLLSSFMGLHAQTVVWSDNFDDEDITNWTQFDVDGDGFTWSAVQIVGEDDLPVGTPVMRSASWTNGVALEPDNWSVSPAVNLSAYAAGTPIQLSWKAMAVDADYDAEHYTVYVGTTATTASLLTSEVTFTETLSGVNELTPRTLDVSSFAGQTIYIAFRHYDVSDEFTMEIDDVAVTANPVAGLKNNLTAALSVYPNPASNLITISNSQNILLNGIEIVDINGRTVKTVAAGGVAETQINISELSSGVYMMNISSDNGSFTKKLVKN